jgi:hypothetical protein
MAMSGDHVCVLSEKELEEMLIYLSDLSEMSESDICDTDVCDSCDSDFSYTVHPPKRIRVEDPVRQWQATDFEPKILMFSGDNSGISGTIDINSSVFDFFSLFFPLHFMQNMLTKPIGIMYF